MEYFNPECVNFLIMQELTLKNRISNIQLYIWKIEDSIIYRASLRCNPAELTYNNLW